MPDKLPKGWVKTTLGEIRRDETFGISQQQMRGEIFELYSVPAFSEGKPYVIPGEEIGSNKLVVSPGDVLLCKINPRINRAWVVGHYYPNRKIASTEWIVFSKQDGIVSDLLRHFFSQDTFKNYLATNVSGVGGSLMRVRPAIVEKYFFPLPPTHEQERIVAKLDASLSRVAAGEAAARRAQERLKRYRAAVLHAAVTGELTRDWQRIEKPKETGTQLLKRMLKIRRGRFELRWLIEKLTLFVAGLKKGKRSRSDVSVLEEFLRRLSSFRDRVQTSTSWNGEWNKQWNEFKGIKLDVIENISKRPSSRGGMQRFKRGFGYLQSGHWKSELYSEPKEPELTDLPKLPLNWVWASVDQMAAHEPRSITDGPFGSNLKTSHYTKSGPRVIRLQNIGDGVFIDDKAHISRKHYEFLKDHAVYPGDLVIRALGIPAPRACEIPDIGPAIVKADCIRFKVADDFIDSRFVLYALNSPMTQRRTEKKIHGVGRPRLNLGEIKAIALPLAPHSEQKQIARDIERRLTAGDRLAATLDRQLDRATATRQSLLREAFAGRLVPQDPDDESASVLLDRIRAAREAEAKKPKAKRMPKSKAKSLRRPLLSVLHEHKKPITPEKLFREAGFQPFEVDSFYRELASLRKVILEKKPSGAEAKAWPYRARVLLQLKKR